MISYSKRCFEICLCHHLLWLLCAFAPTDSIDSALYACLCSCRKGLVLKLTPLSEVWGYNISLPPTLKLAYKITSAASYDDGSKNMSSFPKRLSKQLQKRWELAKCPKPDSGSKIRQLDQNIYSEFEFDVAPLVVDMAGFTARAREFGILHYLAMVEMMRTTLSPIVEGAGGTVVKVEADNLFAYFKTPSMALRALTKINRAIRLLNNDIDDAHRIELSIGVGYGPTLLTKGDMWGSDFNLSCKLGEDLAQTGEVLFSERARAKLRTKKVSFEERSFVIAGQVVTAYSVPLGAL